MYRRASIHRVLSLAGPAATCAAALLLFGLSGCMTPTQVLRPQQAEETPRERYGLTTIGDYCEVADLFPKRVAGIGIVTKLDGTGGDSPHDANHSMLEHYLREYEAKNNVTSGQIAPTISQIMSTGDAALVLVSAEIPPGARYGDHFDVEVHLPKGSKATSLRGGVLEKCYLSTYEANYGPEGASATKKGTTLAEAEGPLQLSLGASEGDDDTERFKKGHVWEGGTTRFYNTLSLVLNSDQQFARRSFQMEERINQTFLSIDTDTKLAKAEAKYGVSVRVPAAYKLNVAHFLRVVRLIPMQSPSETKSTEPGQPKSYQQRLLEDLLDPSRTVTAALRLEALGSKSVPALKIGLQSNHPLVRFCSAESLTYLGQGVGALSLANLVEEQPFLRSYALSALASLDENVTRAKLQELMETGQANETRYGAFRALQALDPRNPVTKGELLNTSFRLHHVAPQGAPLLHLCTSTRAEIVQFGREAQLVPPFEFESGRYTVVAHQATDDHCIVGFVTKGGTQQFRRPCSFAVSDVLHRLAEMDATYPEVMEILLDAANGQKLNCPVALNALPQVPSVEQLAAAGMNGEGLELGNQELGATPTLYERPAPKPAPRNRDADTRRQESQEDAPATGQK
jgi:hypothetical protein